jgi:hypothetical protein
MQRNQIDGITSHITVIGVFPSHQSARTALNRLHSSNLNIEDISIIERDPERFDPEHNYSDVDYTYNQYSAEEFGQQFGGHATGGLLIGGLAGGTLGTLVGLGALTIPGIGPVVAAGPLVGALTGGAAGALAGTFIGALIEAFQMPREHAEAYTERLARGDIMLAVLVERGHAMDVQEILRDAGAERFDWSEEAAPEERPYYWT